MAAPASGYVVWPSGQGFRTLAKAKATARKLARETGRAYIERIKDEKVMARYTASGRANPAPLGKWIRATAIRIRHRGRRLILDIKRRH